MKWPHILVLTLVAFLGGFLFSEKTNKPCEPTKVEQAKESTQEKVQTTKVTKTPDGKIVEVMKLEYRTIEKDKVVVVKQKPLSQYRLGVRTAAGLDFKPSVEATAGYRLNNSTWLEGGYNVQHKEVSLGVAVEF